ncbi:MAG TPA: peptidoglycan-associated lipoprotein Pal [Limnobacter sp.]|uniref:peptidoglycan-associated lipoprotein Pal n=1 Tax=Limnobacter sp. TaxID=2003368 RepID=UPI002EDB5DCE
MKHTFAKYAALSALVAILAACSSAVPLNDKPVESKTGKAPGTTQSDSRAVPTVTPGDMDPLNDPQGVLAKRSVYFDFDSYDVKGEYRTVVQNHAKYLAANANRKVVIQGNTDDRGGAEYNLALGQRRADAVKTLMLSLGVKESQIETVSFGKEKPKATGSNEAAWAENRRADIAYQ